MADVREWSDVAVWLWDVVDSVEPAGDRAVVDIDRAFTTDAAMDSAQSPTA